MKPSLVTKPDIIHILEDLKKREPIFHHPELGTTQQDLENMIDERFWEVGASGTYYSRDHVIKTLVQRYQNPNYKDIWETKDFHCLEIAPNNFLLTYTLFQGTRVTKRATIWRRTSDGWKIVYHQGTLIQKPN